MSSNYPLNSQGSSTAAAPLDSEPGDCLFEFELGWVNKFGTSYTRMRGQSELFNQNQEVFQGRWRVNFIPVTGFESTVQKNYPKLECKAPGSYERFYKIFHGIAHWYPGSCEQHAYQATFVPTTSAFDIQDVIPVDYSYNMQTEDLFWEDALTPSDRMGYPHIKGVQWKTPFDAVFAMPQSGFHMQNPVVDIADFVLLEVSPDELPLQNRIIKGTSSETYNASFEARFSIIVGKEVTEITETSNFTIEEFTDVEFKAPVVILKNGFTAKSGSNFLVKVENSKPEPCFTLVNPNNKSQEGIDSEEHTERPETFEVSQQLVTFPNPNDGNFIVKVTIDLIGGELTVYDVMGRLMLKQTLTEQETPLVMHDRSTGAYIVSIQKREFQIRQKMIIQ